MPSSTHITSNIVQPAQPDVRSTKSQETRTNAEPKQGSQADHHGLYPQKRPAWTKPSETKLIKPAADIGTSPADAATRTESTGQPQAEQHATAPDNPPAHIQLLEEQDRKTYTALWAELPAAPRHWGGERVSQKERGAAMKNIEARQDLDAKSRGILKSRLANANTPEERDKLNKFQEQITQSKDDLDNLFSALQINALPGMPRAKAASAA